MTYKYDVFISYSRKDTIIADEIITAFEKEGITFFIDRRGIMGGMEFPAVLAQAIRESKVFLFLASENSYASKFTQKEIVYAFNKKESQDIIPYIIDGSKLPEELEFTFSDINWRVKEKHPINTVLIDDVLYRLGRERSQPPTEKKQSPVEKEKPPVERKQPLVETKQPPMETDKMTVSLFKTIFPKSSYILYILFPFVPIVLGGKLADSVFGRCAYSPEDEILAGQLIGAGFIFLLAALCVLKYMLFRWKKMPQARIGDSIVSEGALNPFQKITSIFWNIFARPFDLLCFSIPIIIGGFLGPALIHQTEGCESGEPIVIGMVLGALFDALILILLKYVIKRK